ncbi:MYB-like protein [Zalerion maritima]|uniref:MYB-like protein n=1 Tax=Zalerion maritima TaxID=339359 RepID=A0AAD5RNM5_9PEZI|nr:MYB-like protein [Zalerion maritima]
MLLPSAITCDAPLSSQSPHQRPALQQALFASPPASPPPTSLLNSGGGFSNMINTCRSLQSLLASPAPPTVDSASAMAFGAPPENSTAVLNGLGITAAQEPSHEALSLKQLPTPPLTHAPSPFRLRLRPRRTTVAADGSDAGANSIQQRRRIVKRTARGTNNKRRRVHDEETSATTRDNDDVESDLEISGPILEEPFHALPSTTERRSQRIPNEQLCTPTQQMAEPMGPHTPKRARIAPEVLPLGLDRSDYHHLHVTKAERGEEDSGSRHPGTEIVQNEDGEMWSAEDDRILVELVLEKLRLSKQEWNDCARSLGKDRNSVGRRWKSLVMSGEIGVKHRGTRSRGKIHGTWR